MNKHVGSSKKKTTINLFPLDCCSLACLSPWICILEKAKRIQKVNLCFLNDVLSKVFFY